MRSSQEQLNDELSEMYRQMTDPAEIDKVKRDKKRKETINDMTTDYGF